MKYTEINIKSDMPVVGDAMKYLQDTILRLKAQERNNKVKTVIFGENFEIFNFKALELKNKYRELSSLMDVCNHGVTVVEL